MLEILAAVILISAIIMAGLRRITLLVKGFLVQSLAIAFVCFTLGFLTHENHYYLIGTLTVIAKVLMIPYIVNKSTKDLTINREMDPIINECWSSILIGISIAITYVILENFNNDFIKAGFVLMVVGALILVARKRANTQMIGFLTMENGLVLFEISMIKMTLIIDILIVLEILILTVIMAIMIFYINKTFNSVNTDYLSNLKE